MGRRGLNGGLGEGGMDAMCIMSLSWCETPLKKLLTNSVKGELNNA